jgi:Na+/H+-dicarboxylate symporter
LTRGCLCSFISQALQVISVIALFGDVFLNLLKMMVLPLIMCSMITGVTSIRRSGFLLLPHTALQPRRLVSGAV